MTEPYIMPHTQGQANDAGHNMAVWPEGDYLGDDESGPMHGSTAGDVRYLVGVALALAAISLVVIVAALAAMG